MYLLKFMTPAAAAGCCKAVETKLVVLQKRKPPIDSQNKENNVFAPPSKRVAVSLSMVDQLLGGKGDPALRAAVKEEVVRHLFDPQFRHFVEFIGKLTAEAKSEIPGAQQGSRPPLMGQKQNTA